MRGFYVVKNPLVKPSLSINERFSTIEGSTIEGFQCIIISLIIITMKCSMEHYLGGMTISVYISYHIVFGGSPK